MVQARGVAFDSKCNRKLLNAFELESHMIQLILFFKSL